MTTETQETRIQGEGIPLSSPHIIEYLEGAQDTDAGISVSENKSLSSSTVWAAVNILAGAIGSLPMHVFKKRKTGGRELLPDHPVAILVDLEPNPDMTSQVMLESLVTNILLYAAGFIVIVRDELGKPEGLIPIPTQDVSVRRRRNEVEFVFRSAERGEQLLNPLDTIYVPGLTWEGLIGMNPVRRLRGAIATGLAGEQRAAADFKNRSTPAGVLEHPGRLSEEAYNRLRDSWTKKYGGAANTSKTAILEEGTKFNALSFNAEESQSLETRRFQVLEVARIFGVPPPMLYELERATWNNTEQLGLQFVTYSLNRWMIRIEKEFRRKLFGIRERRNHFVKFNSNALLRGDSKTRGEFYGKLWQIGAISINEVRELEDMNPVDDGDDHYVPLNMTKLGEDQQPEPGAIDAPTGEPAPPPAPPDGDDESEAQRVLKRWAASEWERIYRQEGDRLEAAARKYLIKVNDRNAFKSWAMEFYSLLRKTITERLEAPTGMGDRLADAYVKHREARLWRIIGSDDPGNYILKAVRDAAGNKVQL